MEISRLDGMRDMLRLSWGALANLKIAMRCLKEKFAMGTIGLQRRHIGCSLLIEQTHSTAF